MTQSSEENEKMVMPTVNAKNSISTIACRSVSVAMLIFGISADEYLATLSNCTHRLNEKSSFSHVYSPISCQSSK